MSSSASIVVSHLQEGRHAIDIRGHRVVVDQRAETTELEAGPTPVELFVAAVAACVAHSAQMVLDRLPSRPSVTVRCSHRMSETPPWRVAAIDITLVLPDGLTQARMQAVERAVEHCTLRETLERGGPRLTIVVEAAAAAPGGAAR